MGGHVHVTGVAGVGMSALAQALRWTHERVTGSDRFFDQDPSLPIFHVLRAAGVEIVPQDGRAIDARAEAVVYSTAIEEDNPDSIAARKQGVPVKHRAEMLAEMARDQTILAVAGTAGKTTTAGMLGWMLEQLGADPTVINGGALVDWAGAAQVGNVRLGGENAPWVIEVDESDRSLLNFHPEWSILTNISQDHFTLAEVQDLFRAYARQVKRGLVCGAGVGAVLGSISAEIHEVAARPRQMPQGVCVSWRGVELTLRQPGRHNALNAVLAAELCARMGHAPEKIADALSRFGGIQRRLERVDVGGPVRVFDDYAHNPAKIAAAWTAVAEPYRRVLGVWRPHGFGPLRAMLDPLAEAFASVCRPDDRLWILPVFDAGGTADRSIGSEALVARLKALGVAATPAPGFDELTATLSAEARPGDTLLLMGARDPRLPAFARQLGSGIKI